MGHTGSGKSTLAEALGKARNLPIHHLDDYFWRPGWKEAPLEEFRADVDRITSGAEWVVEGNYSRARPLFQDRAELLIWLDLPLSITFPRVLGRTVARFRHRIPVCNGNLESMWMSLFTRESILWWSLSQDRRRRRSYEVEFKTRPHMRLRTPEEIRRVLLDDTRA